MNVKAIVIPIRTEWQISEIYLFIKQICLLIVRSVRQPQFCHTKFANIYYDLLDSDFRITSLASLQ